MMLSTPGSSRDSVGGGVLPPPAAAAAAALEAEESKLDLDAVQRIQNKILGYRAQVRRRVYMP